MSAAVSLSSASSNNSFYNPTINSLDSNSVHSHESDSYSRTLSTESLTDTESIITNHSIQPLGTGKAPTKTQPPYHNPRYLGSIPFYYPPRHPFTPVIDNPYQSTNIDTENVPPIPVPTPSPRYHQTSIDSCWDLFQSSCTDLNKNEPWGDDFQVKTSHTCRIYFQNVNSCSLSSGKGKMNIIAKSVTQAECDITNLAQTSINWRILPIRNRLKEVLQKQMPVH